jgi:hypothetical protein
MDTLTHRKDVEDDKNTGSAILFHRLGEGVVGGWGTTPNLNHCP